MTVLVWLPETRDDIQRLFDFLLAVNPNAAARAVRLLMQGANMVLEHPGMGRPMDDGTKRRELFLPFGASAYVLRYRVENETVVIIRVWHGREARG